MLLVHHADFCADINLTSVSFVVALSGPLLTTQGDVGGQKTLRSYWRNYFEKTDALIWVVDATDRLRIDDCREELHGLLQEEVWPTSTLTRSVTDIHARDSPGQVCWYLRTRQT